MIERNPAEVRFAASPPECPWLREMQTWESLPATERDALLATASVAVDLAESGRVEAGHAVLLTALQRAEEHWNGKPWGQQMVLAYQEALERYAGCYSPARTGS